MDSGPIYETNNTSSLRAEGQQHVQHLVLVRNIAFVAMQLAFGGIRNGATPTQAAYDVALLGQCASRRRTDSAAARR